MFGLLLTLPLLLVGLAAQRLVVEAHTLLPVERLREQIQFDWVLILSLCGAAAVGGVGLAVLVVYSLLPPSRRAIAGGDGSHRIEVHGRAELKQLSASVNELAVAVNDWQCQLMERAGLDAMTGVALRSRFSSAADLRLHQLAGARALMLCLDVDRLKRVNNVLGFEAGDSLILGVAQRLLQLQADGALCGRLAGGTFVALLPLAADAGWQQAVAGLHATLNRKHQWRGQALDLTVSIGAALCPEHGHRAEVLVQRAEQAMFEAKRLRTDAALYSPKPEADRLSHLSLLSELEQAIVQGQLRQVLQPKVRLRDRRITGAEALVRWHHPQRGWLPPSEFVPFAEETGRIRQITHWMLEQAVMTLGAWCAQGRELVIAVNISTLDLQDGRLPGRIESMLARAGVPPHLLQLELTETGLMASSQDPIHVMHSLCSVGVRLSIDDFGTGQSSLAYLQRLPVHELKVERGFVDGVDKDVKRQELLNSIIMLGHGLGLAVTAEGVETSAELEVLQRLGCDLVQGFFIAKPMEAARFDALYQAPQGEHARIG
ncbi:GGDEF domain-containing protein [Roseateles sp.]|uniref:bifunctional diguanylate cyclase/phosphodiesterase n=1 Tax=Roseateles sp. TaxID=1971397 RepID=UPI0025FD11D9|nr:GGDEF domain-containing protein [Roseateles sp.]